LAEVHGFKLVRLFLTCVCWPGQKYIHRQINSIGGGLKLVWGFRSSSLHTKLEIDCQGD